MAGGVFVALLSCAALAAPNDKLVQAQRLFDDLEMEAAGKVLDAALTQGSLDRESLVKLYALQGLVRATLGRAGPARDAFYRLLLLEPSWTLPKNQPPRVKTPFFEAKGMATENGPTRADSSFTTAPGQVTGLVVAVRRDVLKLGRAVVFTVTDEGAERTERVELVDGVATLPVSGQQLRWHARVLAENDNVLLELGAPGAPLEALAPASAPAAAMVTAPPASAGPSRPGSWRRPTGFVLLGVGAAAGIGGAVLGARSVAMRDSLTDAARTDDGVVTGLTQRQAYAIDADARGSAAAANVLFVAAGVVAAAGVGLVVWSLAGDAVAVAPAPGGVVVSGSF